jgi:putative ABC transport system permease protein
VNVTRWQTWRSLPLLASANLLRAPLRSFVTLLCLLAVILPLLVAFALHQGVKDHALALLDAGPDLIVTGDDHGRPAATPLDWAGPLGELPGVVRVVPRWVGRVLIGDLPAVLLATSGETGLPCPGPGQLVLGSALAGQHGLAPGDTLRLALPVDGPERYRNRAFEVIGLLDTTKAGPVWSAALILAHPDDLQQIFHRPGEASELLIWCRPGHEARIADAVSRRLGPASRVQDRSMMERYFHHGFDRRGGAFIVYFLGALVLTVPVLAISSGIGLSQRRREVALLRCIGWELHELLLLQMLESLIIAVAGVSLAVLLALLWLGFGAAWPLLGFLMPGADALPLDRVPYRLGWGPMLTAAVYAVSVTAAGALAAVWRSASADPGEILLGGRG